MEWWDRTVNWLFGPGVQRSGKLHSGPLQRSQAFAERHRAWLSGGGRSALLDELRPLVQREQRSGDVDGLHYFSDAKATGLQLRRPAHWAPDDLRHLHDEWRDRVLALGYRVQHADLRIGTNGEHRERYYLKPDAPRTAQALVDQRYGNILLECWGPHGDEARHLKLLATVYSDRLYAQPLPAAELLAALLEPTGRAFS